MTTKAIFIGGPHHGRTEDGADNPPPFVNFPVMRNFSVVDGAQVTPIYPVDTYDIVYFDHGIAVYLSHDDRRSVIAALADLYLSELEKKGGE